MPQVWCRVKPKAGNAPVRGTIPPELLTQATRMQTAAILCQPDGVTSKQIMKLVDHLIKNEAAGK